MEIFLSCLRDAKASTGASVGHSDPQDELTHYVDNESLVPSCLSHGFLASTNPVVA